MDSMLIDSIGSELIWEFEDLQILETRELFFQMLANTPTDTPSLNSGDNLEFSVMLSADSDVDISNNQDTLAQIVVNSFDPNDKLCMQGDTIPAFNEEPYLRYRIRFENTGTAEAVHVTVKDFLDPDLFDVTTIRPLDASHNYTLQVIDNVAEFQFSEINLGFEDDDNDGYIFFEVKLKDSTLPGDIITNTAEIYFDFNSSIITNTTETLVFDDVVSSISNTNNDYVTVFPNLVVEDLSIQAENISKLTVYDVNGKQVQELTYNHVNEILIPMSNYISGIYFLRIDCKKGQFVKKVIKK